ncbi:DUF2169 family type VI secretion system accessory protein [Sorangium sp. So ce854]|uniref:DUF2169 family type VI secretion system accessory protein n=1 Tax=Sorangium sp. So ce854 TaxID=3133322 RepID=UPI003F628C21
MSGELFSSDAIVSAPGCAAAAVAWRYRGRIHATIVVKATFCLVPDGTMRRIEPEPIVERDVPYHDDPSSSARITRDLAPHLTKVDVVLTGHAYSPTEAPAQSVQVGLAVTDEGRTLLQKSLVARHTAAFQRIPLVYERAFGGAGYFDNPVGLGALPGDGEPNLVAPADPRRPACLGPIGGTWPSRRKLLGACQRTSIEARFADIPDDFAWEYFQAAPPDQRLDRLRGGEWIVLHGVRPGVPRLTTRVPRARGLARVSGLTEHGVAEGTLVLSADTLRIDADKERCTLVWRGQLALPSRLALGSMRAAASVEVEGEPLSWPESSTPTASAQPAPIPTASGKSGAEATAGAARHGATPPRARLLHTVPLEDEPGGAPRPKPATLPFRPDLPPAIPPAPAPQPRRRGREDLLLTQPFPTAAGMASQRLERGTLPFVVNRPSDSAPHPVRGASPAEVEEPAHRAPAAGRDVAASPAAEPPLPDSPPRAAPGPDASPAGPAVPPSPAAPRAAEAAPRRVYAVEPQASSEVESPPPAPQPPSRAPEAPGRSVDVKRVLYGRFTR